jgi:iron complex outermembrane receptor protein
MSYKKIILSTIVLITLLIQTVQSQEKIITGQVIDFETNEPIHFCHIHILGSSIKTLTNIEGKFSINTNGNSKLICSFLGYKSDTIEIGNNTNFKIVLHPKENIINEVTVTGVSKATLIKENPVSITIVSSKAIETASESNIIDVLTKNVAGLNAVKTGPNISKPFIRGLGYNRVLTLYDGVRQEGQQWGDEHGIEVDAYNIEKAEVIKGPASLMYGSDALAGVVSLMPAIPKSNDTTLKVKVFSEYQSNNNLIGNGLRLLYSTKKWSYALRGSYRIAKNYQNNIDGRVYNTGFQETNISGLITYKSKKGYSNFNISLYNNLQGIPDGSRDSLSRKFTKQTFENDLDDIKNRTIVSNAELNSYQLSPLHQHIQHYRIYNNNSYSIGKGEIDILLALQQNNRLEYNHPTEPTQAGMSVSLNTFNYSIRYNTPTIKNLDFSIGSNGMYQNNTNKNATDFPIPDYNLLDAGLFGFTKWKYSELTISGGIRYDIRKIQGSDFYTKTDLSTRYDRHTTDTTGAYLQFPAFDKTFNGLSFSLGSTYLLSEKISIKANIGRGYRAPSITEFASNGLDPGAHIVYLGNRNFKPEFSLQEDIGVIANFSNFTSSLSIFNNNIQNYIYLTKMVDENGEPIVIVKGNQTYQYQQDEAQLYGTEATFDLHPKSLKGFTFNNNFSMVFGFNKKGIYNNTKTNGEYLPFIPPIKLLSSIGQIFKLKSNRFSQVNIKAELDYSTAQNRFLALENTETSTPSFTLFNISSGIDINISKKSTIQLMFQINNLFDKAYQSNLNRLKYFESYSNSPNGKLGMFGMGRNICFKMIFNI